MNYQKIYDMLIKKGQERVKPNGYYEKHHIIPRCCCGTDDAANLVNLTAKEHYVAHHLLLKLYKDTQFYGKLICAFRYMTVGHNGKRLGNAYDYEYMRKLYSENHPMKNCEIAKKTSDGLKKFYSSLTDEERKKRYHRTFTDAERQHMSEITKQHYIMMTDAERKLWSEKLSTAQRKRFDSMNEKEYAEYVEEFVKRTHSVEASEKRISSMKSYLSNLTPEQLRERQKKSFGSCDHEKRGKAISLGKKGKKTNQQQIMGNRYADMSDKEFDEYLATKSHYAWKRLKNLREKVLNERKSARHSGT